MKAIITFLLTIILGVVFLVVGWELLGGFPEIGCIVASAVSGGLVVFFCKKK